MKLSEFLDSGNDLLLDSRDIEKIYKHIKYFQNSFKYYYCSDDFKEVLDDFVKFIDDNKLIDSHDIKYSERTGCKIYDDLDADKNSKAIEILFKFKNVFENETNI